jgi:hypothetical protein
VLGGVLTLTGMIGGLMTNGIPNVPEIMDKVALSMPQGWAMQAWKLSMAGNSVSALVFPTIVMLVLGGFFFVLGLMLFRKRFS